MRNKRNIGRHIGLRQIIFVIGHTPATTGAEHLGCPAQLPVERSRQIEHRLQRTLLGDAAVDGKKFYQQKCSSCHSTDGSPGTGPSFKGSWGTTKPVLDTATGQDVQMAFDEAYVRMSVRDPNRHIAKGDPKYGPPSPMTKFSTSEVPDERIEWIIAFLKTLK